MAQRACIEDPCTSSVLQRCESSDEMSLRGQGMQNFTNKQSTLLRDTKKIIEDVSTS